MNAAQFSRGLGWFSLGLGLTELLAPRQVARLIGVSDDHDRLLRVLGAREIASGLGLLARPKPMAFAWSRVAGDIMDLSLLSAALTRINQQPMSVSRSINDDRRRLTAAVSVVAAITVVDLVTSIRLTQKPTPDPRWHYNPEGGRSGLRRPIEVDRPRYLPVNEQRRESAREIRPTQFEAERGSEIPDDNAQNRQQTEAAPQGA